VLGRRDPDERLLEWMREFSSRTGARSSTTARERFGFGPPSFTRDAAQVENGERLCTRENAMGTESHYTAKKTGFVRALQGQYLRESSPLRAVPRVRRERSSVRRRPHDLQPALCRAKTITQCSISPRGVRPAQSQKHGHVNEGVLPS